MLKEIILKIRYDGNQILSLIESQGLTDDVQGRLELIGVLENMKQLELEKLKTKYYASQKGNVQVDGSPGDYEIVDDKKENDAQDLIDSINPDDYPDEDKTDFEVMKF